MAEVQIRRYEDDDDEVVKNIFAHGMHGLLSFSCKCILMQSRTQMLLACVFCVLLASSKSILLSILAVTLLLAAGRQAVIYLISNFIQNAMHGDFKNIRQTYLEQPNSCFWVAESQGQVVGTVGCCPAKQDKDCVELRRMSVKHSHRGQGIGKALCRAVAKFARAQGCPAVVLYTSNVQIDAQKLYERVGYKKMWYQIRKYRDSDYSSVRELYCTGFREHIGAVCILTLKQHWVQALLLALFLFFLLISDSLLTSLLCLCGVLLVGRFVVQFLFEQGVQLGLREDLLDIQASYMQPGQISCFWVAESKGSIVGTVALLPCVEEPGAWELKRISVKKEYRSQGLAKTLCQTALRFAASHNVDRVVLFTSLVQSDAHKLYHSLGFLKEEEFVWPSRPARLINFLVFKFAYKVTCDKDN